jgi:phosphonoacetaldehyde hydrolase
MGLAKRKHIETMLFNKGRPYTQKDVDNIYANFERSLFEVLNEHTDPLPGVLETVERIRKMGIPIGSTTGYTQAMMDVVVPSAKEKGYFPDSLICPEETSGFGRPYPYMLWRNLEKLGVESMRGVLKVGDTAADMQEGKNAGALSVGVLKGSSMLGLSEREFAEKSKDDISELFETAKQKYMEAGADYIIEDICALPALIESLNEKEGA